MTAPGGSRGSNPPRDVTVARVAPAGMCADGATLVRRGVGVWEADRPGDGYRVRVAVELSGLLDAAEWPERYAAGEVSGFTPYDMHLLADHEYRVWIRGARGGGRRERVNARLLAKTQLAWGYTGLPETPLPGQADVVLAWSETDGVPAVVREGLSRRRVPVVSGSIWLTDESSARAGRLAVAALRRCARVFVLSRAQLGPMRAMLGPRGPRVEMVPFGVTPTTPGGSSGASGPAGEHPAAAHRISRAMAERGELVLAVGNDRHRDHGTVVAAMAEVRRSRPDAQLFVATSRYFIAGGPGIAAGPLRAAELRQALGACRVLAMATSPNLHVSGMTSILEALERGVPVIATRTPGIEDYVEHGVTGLLVPCGDVAAMAAAIAELLADPAKAAAMGRAGQQFVWADRTTAALHRRLARLLKEV